MGGAVDEDADGRAAHRRRTRGILGGTFDPVHVGHLVAATWARDALALDRVLLVVANEPWQKTGHRTVTPAEDRLAVVAAAVDGVPGLEPCRMEIDRGGPSYTVDTVRELDRRHPGTRFFLVVGADVATELDTWHDVGELAGLVTLVIVDRGGVDGHPTPRAGRSNDSGSRPSTCRAASCATAWPPGSSVDFLIPAAAILCIGRLGLYAGGR